MGVKVNVPFPQRDSASLPLPYPFASKALDRKVGELAHSSQLHCVA
jgi:hypothetical protein